MKTSQAEGEAFHISVAEKTQSGHRNGQCLLSATATLPSEEETGKEKGPLFILCQMQGLHEQALNLLEKFRNNHSASQSEKFICFQSKFACLPIRSREGKFP